MSVSEPLLSVILPTDTYDTIADTLAALRGQTVHEGVEVVVVTASSEGLGAQDGAGEGLHGIKVVEVDELYPLPSARSKAIPAASAPIVLLGESHCFPDPYHCEALVRAHRGPWAVVGPAIGNANPATMRSWAALFIDYGPWVEGGEGGVAASLPGHNSSYKRAALLDYGDRLEAMMQSSLTRQADLLARGYGLYLETGAITRHLNITRPVPWVVERYLAGRAFAGARAQGWSRARRLLFAAGSPLIPAVRMTRILRDIRRAGRTGQLLPRLLPALTVGLVLSAWGECMGFARGAGAAMRRVNEMELHKARYVRSADRPDDTGGPPAS